MLFRSPGIALAVLLFGLTRWSLLTGAVVAALLVGLGSLFEGNGRFWSVWQGTGVVLQLCYKCAGGVDLLRKMLYHAYRGKGSHT